MDATFDPFKDRKARDIRNSLSAALVSDLGAEKGATVNQVAEGWKLQKLQPPYQGYIRQTLERYRRVEDQIKIEC
jgi:hypothetical protein